MALSSDSDMYVESSCSSSLDSSSQSDNSIAVSMLDRLRSPTPSDLARKRKVSSNKPPSGLKKGKGQVCSSPKNVSPGDRMKAYPGEE